MCPLFADLLRARALSVRCDRHLEEDKHGVACEVDHVAVVLVDQRDLTVLHMSVRDLTVLHLSVRDLTV